MLTPNPYLHYRIAYRREKLGLSQDELATRIGVTEDYISAVEKGDRRPKTIMLARIAAALGVTMDELNRRERYLWNIRRSPLRS